MGSGEGRHATAAPIGSTGTPGPARRPPPSAMPSRPKRERADILVTQRGLAPSRAQAQALILAGQVRWGDRRVDKPGDLLAEDADLRVARGPRFVSRGGDKLESALSAFVPLGLTVAG